MKYSPNNFFHAEDRMIISIPRKPKNVVHMNIRIDFVASSSIVCNPRKNFRSLAEMSDNEILFWMKAEPSLYHLTVDDIVIGGVRTSFRRVVQDFRPELWKLYEIFL